MDKINIVLLDDHQMFRDGVKAVLGDENNIELIGETGSGKELFDLLTKVKPNLVITDISLPDISGIEVASRLTKLYPTVKILMLSMHTNEEFIVKAIKAGAHGYLPKDTSMDELLEAIHTIHQGEHYFNKDISNIILKGLANQSKNAEAPSTDALTRREKEIVKLVVEGLSNKEIAEKLFISIRTVDSHKTNILQKLNLKSTVELVKFAIRNKIAEL